MGCQERPAPGKEGNMGWANSAEKLLDGASLADRKDRGTSGWAEWKQV